MDKKEVAVSFSNIKKVYGKNEVEVLKNINLDIYDKEFFTLLGPSGCGKTTLLRILGGFENITSGNLKVYDKDISSSLPAYKRPINTVFQNYALFPHMSIYDNVAYGLKMKKKKKSYIKQKVREMLEIVDLTEKETKKPEQLSGGQKQRVALARALANEPKVLLLDEPLSALDYKLRKQMQLQLKHIQREIGITFVFVTHDQEEAMSMSDRVAVMNQGNIQQIGVPNEIYEHPVNSFVGKFIGEANIFDNPSFWERYNDGYRYKIDEDLYIHYNQEPNNKIVCIRPEKIVLSSDMNSEGAKAIITEAAYQGAYTIFILKLLKSKREIIARFQHNKQNTYIKQGIEVKVIFPPEYVRVIDRA